MHHQERERPAEARFRLHPGTLHWSGQDPPRDHLPPHLPHEHQGQRVHHEGHDRLPLQHRPQLGHRVRLLAREHRRGRQGRSLHLVIINSNAFYWQVTVCLLSCLLCTYNNYS